MKMRLCELESILFLPPNSGGNLPANVRILVYNKQYIMRNYGRVPEMQALVLEQGSPDAWGRSYHTTYIDLRDINTHYVYNVIVEIDIGIIEYEDEHFYEYEGESGEEGEEEGRSEGNEFDAVVASSGRGGIDITNPSSIGIPLKSTMPPHEFPNLIGRLRQILTRITPELHGYWIDSKGNVFIIDRHKTGLKGLNFLVDPWMPIKASRYDVWSSGGRDNDVLVKDVRDIFEELNLTLAPYDQFSDYPIGPDGSIYTVRQNAIFSVEEGGIIGEEEEEEEALFSEVEKSKTFNIVGETIDEDEDIITIRIMKIVKKGKGKEPERLAVSQAYRIKAGWPVMHREVPSCYIGSRIVKIRKSKLIGEIPADFDSYNYHKLDKHYKISEGAKHYLDSEPDVINREMLQRVPDDKIIRTLEGKHGDQFVDMYGIIDPNNRGKKYFWDDPVLWSRELVQKLQTPLPVEINCYKWYVGKNADSLYDKTEKPTIPWHMIESPDHPDHPHIMQRSELVSIWNDPEFIEMLRKRGDWENPITGQWERRYKTIVANIDGVEYPQWQSFAEKAFWLKTVGVEGWTGEEITTLRRSSYEYKALMRAAMRSTVAEATSPGAITARSERLELKYGSKEWILLNFRRIAEVRIYPSPMNKINPPREFWEKYGDLAYWNNNGMSIDQIFSKVSTMKEPAYRYWYCRACGGTSLIDGKECNRCKIGKEHNIVPVGNKIVGTRTSTLDVWTGKEYRLYYDVLLKYWTKYYSDLNEKERENVLNPKHQWNLIRRETIKKFKEYDIHLMTNKVKYELGKPIDLSALSDIDIEMICMNWGTQIPNSVDYRSGEEGRREFNEWFGFMMAATMDIFSSIMPKEVLNFIHERDLSSNIRPDVKYMEVITADEITSEFKKSITDIMQRKEEIRKSTELMMAELGASKKRKQKMDEQLAAGEFGDLANAVMPEKAQLKKLIDDAQATDDAAIDPEARIEDGSNIDDDNSDDCPYVKSNLRQYTYGQIDDLEEVMFIRNHIDICSECQEDAEELEQEFELRQEEEQGEEEWEFADPSLDVDRAEKSRPNDPEFSWTGSSESAGDPTPDIADVNRIGVDVDNDAIDNLKLDPKLLADFIGGEEEEEEEEGF